ncbi:hypothetical protein B0A50_01642 [Salinomyces thailandicus]|uniref:F-box domain-containing protein n=1 Tax=Salinomyces thailandicus TaxID=706561 RepID=A0A4U0UBE0_9PEZI|nr:hypothetical protein B0A50_01642 [Salinomyces thailandica]
MATTDVAAISQGASEAASSGPGYLPRLDGLPEELVSNIAMKLGSDDVFALRLSCKSLQAKSFHEFATEYFTEKCFQFTTDSLKVLVAIANDDRLNPYLKEVDFLTSFFHGSKFCCSNGKHCVWQPTVRQEEAFRFYIKDQQQLKQSGKDSKMLTEAFSKLKKVGIIDLHDHMCPSITGKFWGMAKVARTCNTVPILATSYGGDRDYMRWKHHVWKTVFGAFSKSGNRSVSRFGTSLTGGSGNLLSLVNLTVDKAAISALTHSFSNVTHLKLQLDTYGLSKISDEKEARKVYTRIARIFGSIKWLYLRFDSSSPEAQARSTWLFTAFMDGVKQAKLKELALRNLVLDAHSMCKTVRVMKALEFLDLELVDLKSGDWTMVLKAIQKMKSLNHLHLMYLSERRRRAYFGVQPEEPQDSSQWSEGPDDFDPFAAMGMPGAGMAPAPPMASEDSQPYDSWDDIDSDDDFPPLTSISPPPTEEEHAARSDAPDNEMPDLVPGFPPVQHSSKPIDAAKSVNENTPLVSDEPEASPHLHSTAKHCALDAPDTGIVGYCVCLSNEQIQEEIPTLIKEYYVEDGGDLETAMFGPPGGIPIASGNPPPVAAAVANFLGMFPLPNIVAAAGGASAAGGGGGDAAAAGQGNPGQNASAAQGTGSGPAAGGGGGDAPVVGQDGPGQDGSASQGGGNAPATGGGGGATVAGQGSLGQNPGAAQGTSSAGLFFGEPGWGNPHIYPPFHNGDVHWTDEEDTD